MFPTKSSGRCDDLSDLDAIGVTSARASADAPSKALHDLPAVRRAGVGGRGATENFKSNVIKLHPILDFACLSANRD
jgi:hypothetical protein